MTITDTFGKYIGGALTWCAVALTLVAVLAFAVAVAIGWAGQWIGGEHVDK